MQSLLILLTGLTLGVRHAFDRDHVAAVTHFVSLEPDPVKSAWFGCRWAIGHALTILGLGSLVLLFHLKFDPAFQRYAELLVGVSLLIIGCWRLVLLWQERQHEHQHAHGARKHTHPHSHEPGVRHVHWWAPTLVGMVHGAAGIMEVVVLLPITVIASAWLAYAYLGLFSLGCAASMSGYGFLAGRFYRRATQTGRRVYQALVILTSSSGLVLGGVWILKNL